MLGYASAQRMITHRGFDAAALHHLRGGSIA